DQRHLAINGKTNQLNDRRKIASTGEIRFHIALEARDLNPKKRRGALGHSRKPFPQEPSCGLGEALKPLQMCD
ncbi:MAG: hypothetical protein ACREVJ_07385, partial [Gammaproteobacteria bacterium]